MFKGFRGSEGAAWGATDVSVDSARCCVQLGFCLVDRSFELGPVASAQKKQTEGLFPRGIMQRLRPRLSSGPKPALRGMAGKKSWLNVW